MSKILKRPMFRKGGPAMTGIMSGIKPRQNYKLGEDVEAYRDEFTEAYGSVPSGGAFDPLTQLLIGFGQKAMTTPSSGNALRDLVEASKDPSKQFFKAKSKEAADKRNIQLAATKFGLTEAGKDRRQQKAIDFQEKKLGDVGDAKLEARTETYFKTYGDQKKASNHAKYDFGIQETLNEKFGSSQVGGVVESFDALEKISKQKKNIGKVFYNVEDGTVLRIKDPKEGGKPVEELSITELATYEAPKKDTGTGPKVEMTDYQKSILEGVEKSQKEKEEEEEKRRLENIRNQPEFPSYGFDNI